MPYDITIPSKRIVRQKGSNPSDPVVTQESSVTAGRATDNKPERTRVRKPSGWLVPTSYSRDVYVYRNNPGYLHLTDGKRGGAFQFFDVYVPDGVLVPSVADITALQESAEAKALARLKGQQVNLSVSLAEVQATANTFGHATTRIAQMTRALRKGRLMSEVWKATKTGKPVDDVLAYLYGVRPLIADVNGSLDELRKADTFDPFITVKASTREDEKQIARNANPLDPRIATNEGFSGAFVRLDFETENNLLASMGRIGLTNPLATIYELIPYSFVLDWALPIGGWISSLDATMGFRFRSGSVSTLRKVTTRTRPEHSKFRPSQGWSTYDAQFEITEKKVRFRRVRYSAPPKVPFPRIRNPLNLSNAASGLALLIQAFK